MGAKSNIDKNYDVGVDVADIQIPMFSVVLYNDDYTTFDFVIVTVIQVFHRSADDAERIAMNVHKHGKGIVGKYPRDIAEMKVQEVHRRAQAAGYPLRAGIES